MKATNFLWLVLASNVATFAVTTLAVIYAWNSCKKGTDASINSLGWSSVDADDQITPTRSREAQECCSCSTSPAPTPAPTPAPVQVLNSVSFTCPPGEGSIDLASSGPLEFSLSSSNRLCTLVMVAPGQTSFKPIGRSYDGNDWEAAAGDFSTLSWSCTDGSSCVTTLPDLASGAMYKLKSYDAPQLFSEEVDEIARFLEQATFGPTRTDIANFDQSNLPQAFANYIKDQTTFPLTSHRAMFRRHLNTRMEFATEIGAVTHPCQRGTRYRRFAFSAKDERKYIDITTVGNRKVLSIDGFVRTVVEGPITYRWDEAVVFQDGR